MTCQHACKNIWPVKAYTSKLLEFVGHNSDYPLGNLTCLCQEKDEQRGQIVGWNINVEVILRIYCGDAYRC